MSNQSKHTPGPYHIGALGTIRAEPVPRPDGSGLLDQRILARMEPGLHVSPEENEANAKLFISAPDLLDACKEFVRKVEAGQARSVRSYQQMKAAIAKATA